MYKGLFLGGNMTLNPLLNSFSDEFAKIAGSLQGYVRSGRRPISASKLLEKEKKVKKAVITKLSGAKLTALKLGITAAGGASVFELARRANEDRKLGKLVRQSQDQGQ
jgi:hypothetical protein